MACCLQDAEYMLRKPPSEPWDIIITHGEELQDSEGGCRVLVTMIKCSCYLIMSLIEFYFVMIFMLVVTSIFGIFMAILFELQ